MILATVRGRVAVDAVMRYSKSGMAVLSWSVASNRKVKGVEETTWVRCTAFDEMADQYAPKIVRGTYIETKGKLSTRSWTDRKGQTRVDLELIADSVNCEVAWQKENQTTAGAPAVRPAVPISSPPAQISFSDDDIPF